MGRVSNRARQPDHEVHGGPGWLLVGDQVVRFPLLSARLYSLPSPDSQWPEVHSAAEEDGSVPADERIGKQCARVGGGYVIEVLVPW